VSNELGKTRKEVVVIPLVEVFRNLPAVIWETTTTD